MSHTIYMIRHGQTDWNAGKRLQGQTDVPMNDFGRTQVHDCARRLKRVMGDPASYRYVTSPIGRAVASMKIVREVLDLASEGYEVEDRLCELDYGEFSGHSWSELRRLRPLDVEQRFFDSWNYVVPGGESYAQLARRVFQWFDAIDGNTVLTAHAGVSRILQSRFLDIEPAQIAFLDAPQDHILVIRGGKHGWL